MKKERLTSQKQIILNYLQSVTSHPTAEDIYLAVKKKLPRISQATVYRTLNNLNDKGMAQVIASGGVSHFDGNAEPHAHFVCQQCRRVFDVFEVCEDCNIISKKKTSVGEINYYQIYFHGICYGCKKKQN